jgi:hypothetical protein
MKIHLSETEFLKAELKRLQDDMQALAAPVQEPVAWPCEIEEADFEQDTITLKMLTSEYVVRAGKHWLSTTPPAAQRQWVGLTDEQIKAIDEMALTKNMAIVMTMRTLKEVNT